MKEHEFGPTCELKVVDAVKIIQYCRDKNRTELSEIITVYCENWEKGEEPVDVFKNSN